MSKAASAAFFLGAAGFLMGCVALYMAFDAKRTADTLWELQETDEESIGALGDQIAGAGEAMRAVNKRVTGIQNEERQLRDKVRELMERLDDVETLARSRGGSPGTGPVPVTEGPINAAAPTSEDQRRFEELHEKVWSGTATVAEEAKFWELARKTGAVDRLIAELKTKVDAQPADNEARMNLAGAYTAKLLTVPDGPERGAWAMMAEQQYQKVLEQDPSHWQAGYSLAFSWSQWPDFANKTPDAIKQFESVRDVQERLAPAAEHVNVYLQLSQLYRKQGNQDRAREVLESGLQRHPDADDLRKALDASTR